MFKANPKKEIQIIFLNPLLDLIFCYRDHNYKVGYKHFTNNFIFSSGGMGINMARALKTTKARYCIYLMLGGLTGDIVCGLLKKENINFKATKIKDQTRVATIISNHNDQMFVGPSPRILEDEIILFKEKFFKRISKNNIVVIGGSLPDGCDRDIYLQMIRYFKKHNTNLFLDTRSYSLDEAIKEPPFLVKVDDETIYTFINKNSLNIKDKLNSLLDVHKKGVNIIVYSGNYNGIYGIYNNKIYYYKYPEEIKGNSFGAGDAFLAGMVCSFNNSDSIDEAFRTGIAFGTSCFLNSDLPGNIDIFDVEKLKSNIEVKQV